MGTDWQQGCISVLSIQQSILALVAQGHQVQLWWAPGHQGIIRNESAETTAKAAMEESWMTLGEFLFQEPCSRGPSIGGTGR